MAPSASGSSRPGHAAPLRRIEFCYTANHDRWLNITENELRAGTGQRQSERRTGDLETLRDKITARSTNLNTRPRGVAWHMDFDDARCKLKSIYPESMV